MALRPFGHGAGIGVAGLLTSAAVWVFAHQVGYLWGDGTFARMSRKSVVRLALLAALGLALLVGLGPYPASMVAVPAERIGNMFPTTLAIGVPALLQATGVQLLYPRLSRLADRRGVWKAVVGVCAMAMTVFLWHMTADLGWILVGGWLGVAMPSSPRPCGGWNGPCGLSGPACCWRVSWPCSPVSNVVV